MIGVGSLVCGMLPKHAELLAKFVSETMFSGSDVCY